MVMTLQAKIILVYVLFGSFTELILKIQVYVLQDPPQSWLRLNPLAAEFSFATLR